MKQLCLICLTEKLDETVSSCTKVHQSKRKGPLKEVKRVKACLLRALDRMLREYPKWNVGEINNHVWYCRQVRRSGKLHQIPEVIALVKKYTSKVAPEQRSRIKRDIELAERWYNQGMCRVLRDKTVQVETDRDGLRQ